MYDFAFFAFSFRQFIGRLESDGEDSHACIAVTKHEDPLYWGFTILFSEKLNHTMFVWYPENGTVISIMEPFTENGENRDEVDKSDKSDNKDINIKRGKRQVQDDVPPEAKLKIKVGAYHLGGEIQINVFLKSALIKKTVSQQYTFS